ncbi:hypothetical protein [Glutamicibacter arilaitensis]|uniref:hypothetical protein n=1 Tax=Glutamicibacter arilaitensis TaxID=256701 RepID=UPI00384E19E0
MKIIGTHRLADASIVLDALVTIDENSSMIGVSRKYRLHMSISDLLDHNTTGLISMTGEPGVQSHRHAVRDPQSRCTNKQYRLNEFHEGIRKYSIFHGHVVSFKTGDCTESNLGVAFHQRETKSPIELVLPDGIRSRAEEMASRYSALTQP